MNVAVLGGGVTGLTAAWKLSGAGHSVRVFESSPRLGGSVRSDALNEWLVEAGPNALQESTPERGVMFAELGLGPERITAAPEAKHRYIARKGELVALPTPSDLAGLVATPLLSFGSKLKVSSEVTRLPKARTEDISIAEMVREHFGSEILDRFVQPLIGGIYAGDAERLSARYAFPKIWEAERTTGSLVRAGLEASKKRKALGLAPSTLTSFRGGLQALPVALAAPLGPEGVLLEANVRAIGRGSRARWRIDWNGPGGSGTGNFDCVVCALPAWALASLEIGGAGKRPLGGLGAIEHPPVATVFVGYRRDKVRHPLDGFGVLVPRSENLSVLGVVFSSSLFAGRAPDGCVALTAFAGGALQPEVAQLPPAELIRRVCGDLGTLLGAEGRPVFTHHALWARAIPQYNLGYGLHLDAMRRCEEENPGLFIGGNARDGISLHDCIASGTALAKRVS